MRGGLTPKHIDVAELLQVVRFESWLPHVQQAEAIGEAGSRYNTPAEEFELWALRVDHGHRWESPAHRRVEILLATDGKGEVSVQNGPTIGFAKGTAVLMPAAAGAYAIAGRAMIFRAALPEDRSALRRRGPPGHPAVPAPASSTGVPAAR